MVSVYYRPFNLASAINMGGEWKLQESPQTVLNAFQAFPKKPTVLAQVISSLEPALYSRWREFLLGLKSIVPNLAFGVGISEWNLNDSATWDKALRIVKNYRQDTYIVSVENFVQMIANSGEDRMLKFLQTLNSLGFAHILVTNWKPLGFKTGDPKQFKPWPYVTGIQTPLDDVTLDLNMEKLNLINSVNPDIAKLVNYEAPGGLRALSFLSNKDAIVAMSKVADKQNSFSISYKWTPPWAFLYDPYAKGTLDWIKNKLAEIDPRASPSLFFSDSNQPAIARLSSPIHRHGLEAASGFP